MCSRFFILCRNTEYAYFLSDLLNGIVRTTESELLGITPVRNDVFIIDAHFGGLMTQLQGIELSKRILKSNPDTDFRVIIISWFSKDYVEFSLNYPRAINNDRLKYKQLPIINSEILS